MKFSDAMSAVQVAADTAEETGGTCSLAVHGIGSDDVSLMFVAFTPDIIDGLFKAGFKVSMGVGRSPEVTL